MRGTADAGDLVVLVLAVAAVTLLGTTIALGLAGATTASGWTGTAGGILLLMWLMALSGNAGSRAKHTRKNP